MDMLEMTCENCEGNGFTFPFPHEPNLIDYKPKCYDCIATGKIPSPAGEEILAFIKKYLGVEVTTYRDDERVFESLQRKDGKQ